jgi:predicted dehydrogenase
MPNDSSSPKAPLRGAIVGAGNIAQTHREAWAGVSGAELVAVADLDRSRAESLADAHGIAREHVYSSAPELFERETIDFVDVATTPETHREVVLTAASHGIDVVCQKPFATSLAEADEMLQACESAGIRCIVNENYRFRRWFREVKSLLDDGAIGTPRYASFRYHGDEVLPQPDGSPPAVLGRQPYIRELPRVILFEWGIHLIDVLRFLFGDVHSVSADLGRTSPLIRGEDLAVVRLQFSSGVLGVLDISWGTRIAPERRLPRGSVEPFLVEGDAGSVELDPYPGDLLTLTGPNGQTTTRPANPDTRREGYLGGFRRAQQHFVDCLRSGEPAETEARAQRATLEVMLGAYEAAALGKSLILAPADS